jgi:hypothetical protein
MKHPKVLPLLAIIEKIDRALEGKVLPEKVKQPLKRSGPRI